MTHAWQITNKSFLGVICSMSNNYNYRDESGEWSKRPWNGFTNEQQAHIVDDWYGAHVKKNNDGTFAIDAQGMPETDLDGFDATNDPAFRFISENIRQRQI